MSVSEVDKACHRVRVVEWFQEKQQQVATVSVEDTVAVREHHQQLEENVAIEILNKDKLSL